MQRNDVQKQESDPKSRLWAAQTNEDAAGYLSANCIANTRGTVWIFTMKEPN